MKKFRALIPLLPMLFAAIFFVKFSVLTTWLQFFGGVCLGFWLILLDRALHALYLFPEQEFSKIVQQLWQQKKVFQLMKVLSDAGVLQSKLLTRSVLFLGAYVTLTFFVLTSTGSALGMGLMLGIGLRHVIDMLEYRTQPTEFHRQFLWQVKRKFSQQEVHWLIGGFAAFLAIVSFLVLV